MSKPTLNYVGKDAIGRDMTQTRHWTAEGHRPRVPVGDALRCTLLVGRSRLVEQLRDEIETLAPCTVPVLIDGETGVGKNLVARAIHEAGPRAEAPFIELSAANLNEHLFESELFGHVKGAFSGAHQDHPGLATAAGGGTLFVNEVGELSLANQAKLLHFLDSMEVRPVGGLRFRKVDVRIVAATNRDLPSMVRQQAFRQDLYFRLAVVAVRVPSLRERRDDIALLAEHFLARFARQDSKALPAFSEDALEFLLSHDWPGNVRELENTIRRAVVMTPSGQRIEVQALHVNGSLVLPAERGQRATTLEQCRENVEREVILSTVGRHGWNVAAAARDLQITRVGLSRKLKRLGITRPGRHDAD